MIQDFAYNVDKKPSFFSLYLQADLNSVSHLERHNPHSYFTICTIFASKQSNIKVLRNVPLLLARYRDHIYADNIWDHQVLDARAVSHAKMGLDQDKGGVIVVRPDGYVGIVVSLVEGSATVDALNDYFGAFCSRGQGAGCTF